MLPLELLKVIFGALSRDDLDALMLTTVRFRDIALRDFAREPLRHFETLRIYANQCYGFCLTPRDEHRCVGNDDFAERMRYARVGKLE